MKTTTTTLVKTLLGCMFLLFSVSAQSAKIVRVDAASTATTPDGLSWENAYPTLVAALLATASGDQIWVAAGEYQPATGAAFAWKSGVNIYGGFDPETAPDMASRDYTENVTVLKSSGTRVLYPAVFTVNTYVDGFSLTGQMVASLNGSAAYLRAGAHLVNCRIHACESGANGIINLDGKGTSSSDALTPSLSNCIIENNNVSAAAVYINTQGIIRNCIIRNNTSTTGNGGGVHFNLGGRIENSVIRDNQSPQAGGGIYAQFNTGVFTEAQNRVCIHNCSIFNNMSALAGGVYCDKLVELVNCVVANNEADDAGGIRSNGATIINCTITNNKAKNTDSGDTKGVGGGAYLSGVVNNGTLETPTIVKNSILWGNAIVKQSTLPQYAQLYNEPVSAGSTSYRAQITNSAIQGLTDPLVLAQTGVGCFNLADDNLNGPRFSSPATFVGAGSQQEEPEIIERTIPLSSITKSTAFSAGTDAVHSYRIPAIVTAKDGSLLVFAEARKKSWMDKSATDVVVKRSVDGGKTWSALKFVTAQTGSYAYMDPTPVVDKKTGRIFVFMTRWVSQTALATSNRAFMSYSDDHGVTWSTPQDVTSLVVATDRFITGFGPGSGFQMRSAKYPDRLIVPTRQYDETRDASETRTVYSDDHGQTWKIGNPSTPTGEQQIAELGGGVLAINLRRGGGRNVGYSYDGGVSWSSITLDPTLTAPAKGCQGSVWANDDFFFYVGPQGGTTINGYDDRYNLIIWRSLTDGKTWKQQRSLYAKASGYSCQTTLPDGRLAIVFETADTQGFTKSSSRGAGWMRLDVMIVPKDILDPKCWFEGVQ